MRVGDRARDSRETETMTEREKKKHGQNFKLCLWHRSHTLTSTAAALEYLQACQTALRAIGTHREIKENKEKNGYEWKTPLIAL